MKQQTPTEAQAKMALYQQALNDHERYPHLVRRPRFKTSLRSQIKRARKVHTNRASAAGRPADEVWYAAYTHSLFALAQIRREMARVCLVEKMHNAGTLCHPHLIFPMRKHGSFAAWRKDLLETAKLRLRASQHLHSLSNYRLP